jgi:hypothetical protein
MSVSDEYRQKKDLLFLGRICIGLGRYYQVSAFAITEQDLLFTAACIL